MIPKKCIEHCLPIENLIRTDFVYSTVRVDKTPFFVRNPFIKGVVLSILTIDYSNRFHVECCFKIWTGVFSKTKHPWIQQEINLQTQDTSKGCFKTFVLAIGKQILMGQAFYLNCPCGSLETCRTAQKGFLEGKLLNLGTLVCSINIWETVASYGFSAWASHNLLIPIPGHDMP